MQKKKKKGAVAQIC